MDQQTLELFTRQLAHWAESAIGEGRSPFRKVEISPPLMTKGGEMAPPLVFWINRESFMAGGVLLLPRRGSGPDLEAGLNCARALGLRHFVTWSPTEIGFWEESGNGASPCRTLPLSASDAGSAVAIRASLLRILEELKLFSVLGAVPPEELSPYYLVNLCRGTVQTCLPGLAESYRIAWGESRSPFQVADPFRQAYQKGALTLVRLVALQLFDRLATAVQPEGLERAMLFALDTLPGDLRQVLARSPEELPLPAESAVRFHHLFRRLTQLRLGENRQRSEALIHLLLQHGSVRLGGFPPPGSASPSEGPLLVVNVDSCPEGPAGLMAVASPPLLGLIALLRSLRGEPEPLALAATAATLAPPVPPRSILGTLSDGRIPPPVERPALTARLRSTWPMRRFPLHPQTPCWFWECLHLLGMAAPGGAIELSLPDTWLVADFGEPLANLIREEFTLEGLGRKKPAQIVLRLKKGSFPETPCVIEGFEGRLLSRERMLRGGRSLLAMALDLPEGLFRLLEDGRLELPCKSGRSLDLKDGREVFLFTRSSLGRYLWSVVSASHSLPQRKHLFRDAIRFGLPLPPPEILTKLKGMAWREGEPPPAAEIIDEELAVWLGGNLEFAEADSDRPIRKGGDTPFHSPPDAGTEEEIASAVFVDGLPRFPDQYLFDYYRPSLSEYAFPGPLEMGEEFLGLFILRGPDGFTLEVEGAETARALQLCSHAGGGRAALPADRHLTAEILERYLTDLKDLRQNLVRRTHGKIPDPQKAAHLVEKIWKAQSLPPWTLVAD